MGVFRAFQHYLSVFSLTSIPNFAFSDLTVTLPGYGSFTGTVVSSTLTGKPLPLPVEAWLGIDYASQPIGEGGRFKPVEEPPVDNSGGAKDASQYGKVCIQDPATMNYPQDEACLNMNVYRRMGNSTATKVPVLVWIHGGSFVLGSGRSFDGASFVSSSKEPLIAVTFNYRLNSLGFLPSTLFEQEGLLNLGLLDQVQLLKFVQQYISYFGGDPENVTIGGRSAGAHSVGIHYFSNYKNEKPLFSKAILQSGSVTARSFPGASYPLYQAQYAQYLELIGCSNTNTNQELQCLRSANITKIRDASSTIYSASEYAITWPFQPTLGGPLLEKPGSVSGIEGTFYHLPIITTNVNDEAKFYAPGNLTTNDDFLNFLHNINPGLNTDDMDLIESLYPDPLKHGNASPYANSPNSTQYNRVSTAASDYMYICPGQETAFRTSEAGVPTWKLRFNTNNSYPAWQGIPHTADTKYTWNAPDVQHPDVSPILHGYFASFVVSGDPNPFRYEGSPEWPRYDSDDGTGPVAKQLLVEPNATRVEEDGIRKEQCLFWRDPERAVRLNK